MVDDRSQNKTPKLLAALRENQTLQAKDAASDTNLTPAQEAVVSFNPWNKSNTPQPSHVHDKDLTIEQLTSNAIRANPININTDTKDEAPKDPLTGLFARPMLYRSLDDHIRWSQQKKIQSAFLMAAIDNLATINSAFGVDIGDQIVHGIADRLAKHLRQGDQIGHYSTNKFGLILKSCGSIELQKAAARFLYAVANEPIETAHGSVPLTISIGAVLFPKFGKTSKDVIGCAIECLDQARHSSSNRYVIYDHSPSQKVRRENNLLIADTIVQALKEEKVKLAIQPIVCCTSRTIWHYECLLVIEEEGGNLISASEFMPMAEQLGLARLIDYRVMELAIDLLRAEPDYHLAINVSSNTTRDPEWLVSLRRKAKGKPELLERLTIEITETTSIYDIDETTSFADALKELGCQIAVDDFGAGYSSYKNLKKINADIVKIDGEFIKNITDNHTDQLFVKSLIELAKSMNTKVVAEWVHNEDIALFLEEAGVDYMQGYLFGKPALATIAS